ncbi:TonB-dependent receptor [Altererythrobacter sp. C41]|uniref:TonB-dependent receptor n=1 Tax=Altererythrobacter sp. C41 TaxID=2806021 RepID=UPI00193237ED|nr:TonB-dependent receptor [Altererythrobacter sp. C41]MBM0170553.1 TonB-dependent receptor [Altererythrobacter sp. C41]
MSHTQSHTVRANPRFARKLAAALALGVAGGALSLAMVAPAHAQQVNASLRGTITGAEGVSQVAAIEVDTGIRRTAVVDAGGGYTFASLRPGNYRLEITTADGVRSTDQFTLRVAQNAVLDFDLSAPQAAPTATGEELPDAGEGGEIIVTANRIRTMEGGEVGVNITQRLIEQLPQNNRNFLAFADLAPGVQFITGANGDSRLQGGAQNSSTVNVFIDGVGQKDYVLKNGVTGQDSTQGNPFPQLAIGEYRVISSNYKAEFDQVSSVAITAVTKSGTNEFEGQGFVDFTNQDLRDARPIEIFGDNPGKVESRDLQFGGALGGPIIKDVLHFFATYEGKRRVEPRDAVPGLDLPVSFFPEEYQGYFGARNQEFNEDLYFGKLTFSPTSRDIFDVSVKFRDEYGEQYNGGIAAYDTRSITNVREWRGLARWEHTGDNFVNDFKVAYEDVFWNPRPFTIGNTTLFTARVPGEEPGTTRRGDILRFGGGSNFQNKGQKGWQVSNDFTYTGFSNHTLKFGVKAKWVRLNSDQRNNLNPVFSYLVTYDPTDSGLTFNDQIPYRLQFSAPVGDADPRISSKNFQFGIYAQDDWEVTDRLTLNLGVRWDYERTPAFLDYVHDPEQVAAVSPENYPNLNNANYDINDYISTGNERKAFTGAFQPRLGFSYELDDESRFVLFGGYGRSYDRTQFDFIQQELAQGLFAGRTFQFIGADADSPCTPGVTCIAWDPIYLTEEGRQQLIDSVPVGTGRELRFIKNDLKVPYSDQFSLGLRGRFNLLDLEVGYTRVNSHDGFVYLLGNRRPDGSFFPPSGNPSSPWGFAPSPFGNLIIGDNGLETRANTGYLKLTKRYTETSRWSLDATYTYTDAEENRSFGEVFALDFPSIEDYPFVHSAGVRTHRLVMAGTVDLPMDMVLAGKFQISSPKWQTSFVSVEGDPLSRDVIAVETEGNGDRWGYRQMDLALTKYLNLPFVTDDTRIWVRADVINLFNDRNYNSFNAETGERNLGSFGTDGPPRTIKFSAGFSF